MILHDLRNASRRLLARPGYSALSIGVLGLGLGAVLFLLGVINGMILEPMPFPHADRLMAVGEEREIGFGIGRLRSDDYITLKRELGSIEAFGAYSEITANLSLGAERGAKRYDGVSMSQSMFGLLGVQPLFGRLPDAADDQPGAPLTLLLGERAWRDDFAADPDIVGRTIKANGEAATIIGVLPEAFAFPFIGQVWVSQRMRADDGMEWQTVARLKPDTTLQQARAELEAVSQRLGHDLAAQREDASVAIKPLGLHFVNELTRQLVWIMFGACLLVLLLACANVANLQLAQTLTRRRELAVRCALGASRRQLLRDLLAESLLLSLAAASIGLVVAHFGGRWLIAMFIAAEEAPAYFIDLSIDARMVGFAMLAALATTLLAGLLPALRASRADVQDALRDGDKGSGGGFAKLARGLVVAEVALTVVLLVGAGMFIRALDALVEFDFGTGADPQTILTGRVGLFPQDFPTGADQVRFFERVVERLRADPDVLAASAATALPGTAAGARELIGAAGAPKPAEGYRSALVGHVDDHFADTYGLKLTAGRFLDARDQADSAPVVVIDARLAATLWPDRDPLGQVLQVNPQRGADSQAMTVVGVTTAIHLEDADDPVLPTMLVPLRQHPTRFATIALRTRGDAAAFAPRLAEAVRAEHADTPVYWLRTQQQAIDMGMVGPLILTQIFGAVGLLALGLAAAGLYGVLAFSVEQRTREIGIRRAIGASSRGIVANVSRRLLWQVGLGLGIGVLLGLPWSALLENPLLQTRGYDGLVFVVVVAVIAGVTVVASLAPLRRALRVDPIIALRHE